MEMRRYYILKMDSRKGDEAEFEPFLVCNSFEVRQKSRAKKSHKDGR